MPEVTERLSIGANIQPLRCSPEGPPSHNVARSVGVARLLKCVGYAHGPAQHCTDILAEKGGLDKTLRWDMGPLVSAHNIWHTEERQDTAHGSQI